MVGDLGFDGMDRIDLEGFGRIGLKNWKGRRI